MTNILEINNLTKYRIDKKYFEKVAENVFKISGHKKIKISLVFTDEKLSEELNSKYRGKNQSTDVLSFSYSENEGEIVICYSIAVSQAKENKISIKNELTRLLVHGILHLAGYDHITKEEELDTQNLEANILAHL